MQILAVTNVKGGVGKTTTAVNLAWLSAAGGERTVLWDLDPQGAASWLLHEGELEATKVRKLVSGKRELPEVVVATAYPHLDLLPSDPSYRGFDAALAERRRPTERLLKMSRPLAETHARLVLDCPPGLSLLTENVLRAADAVVVPLLASPLSVRMLEQLDAFVAAEGWEDVRLLPFFSMVDRRKSLHAEVIDEVRRRFPDVLATEVPYWSEIERMTRRRAPLPAYAPGSAAARVYVSLWAEIAARLPR